MSYSKRGLRTNIAGHDGSEGGMRAQMNRIAGFHAACGWSLRQISAEVTITTTAPMSTSFALAGHDTYIFWRVVNNITGNCVLIGDVDTPLDPAILNFCPRFLNSGSQAAASVHTKVIEAVFYLTGWVPSVSLSPTSTRFVRGEDGVTPENFNISFGASLNTTVGVPTGEGWVCRCKASTTTALVGNIPTTFGGANFSSAQTLKPDGKRPRARA